MAVVASFFIYRSSASLRRCCVSFSLSLSLGTTYYVGMVGLLRYSVCSTQGQEEDDAEEEYSTCARALLCRYSSCMGL